MLPGSMTDRRSEPRVRADKRSEPRFRFELAITLTAGRRTWQLSTHDVSYRGMFVSLDEPPRPRELVRIDATLPDGQPLTLQGMIAFLTPEGDDAGRPRGAGIQFFGSGGPEHEQWEGFVRKVWEEQHRHKARSKRSGAHASVVLRLRAKDTTELEDAITSILSNAGLPIDTEHALAVGSPIALELVHPHTGEVCDLPCVVRKRAEGVGVGLADVGTEQRRSLAEFVSSGAKSRR
jgi:Tfp pilus assembly protein PilZ